MFERLLEGVSRLPASSQLFFSQNLLALQLGNAFFIGRHHGVAARVHDAIKQLINLLLDLPDILLHAFRGVGCLRKTHVPSVAEHRFHERKQALCGL
ncbi:hypothetical protein [Limimaricola cinnabarinus]|uniref:hypothetical protein n=1 Tax=Limimaricola cinnabarinus TaxID=1125964 RepID=UPI002FDF9C5B